uniref:CRI4 n=1 Tax=Arundo donax TaxID=35708 RepID=A0A0A8YX60_ARUDO
MFTSPSPIALDGATCCISKLLPQQNTCAFSNTPQTWKPPAPMDWKRTFLGASPTTPLTVSSPQQNTVLFRANKPQLNTEPAEMADTASVTCVAVILYPQQSITDVPASAP